MQNADLNSMKELLHALLWSRRHLSGALRVPELDQLARFIGRDDVCIDIGAHAGSWLFPLGRLADRGEVHGFEALPYYARTLRLTRRLVGPKNTHVINKAVTDDGRPVSIVWCDSMGRALTGLTHVAGPSETASDVVIVESVVLDQYFAGQERRISFMKIDVEGGELGVLRGATGLIEKFRPVIYTEISEANLNRYGDSLSALFDYFTSRNYGVYFLGANGAEPLDLVHAGEINDALFIPGEQAALI